MSSPSFGRRSAQFPVAGSKGARSWAIARSAAARRSGSPDRAAASRRAWTTPASPWAIPANGREPAWEASEAAIRPARSARRASSSSVASATRPHTAPARPATRSSPPGGRAARASAAAAWWARSVSSTSPSARPAGPPRRPPPALCWSASAGPRIASMCSRACRAAPAAARASARRRCGRTGGEEERHAARPAGQVGADRGGRRRRAMAVGGDVRAPTQEQPRPAPDGARDDAPPHGGRRLEQIGQAAASRRSGSPGESGPRYDRWSSIPRAGSAARRAPAPGAGSPAARGPVSASARGGSGAPIAPLPPGSSATRVRGEPQRQRRDRIEHVRRDPRFNGAREGQARLPVGAVQVEHRGVAAARRVRLVHGLHPERRRARLRARRGPRRARALRPAGGASKQVHRGGPCRSRRVAEQRLEALGDAAPLARHPYPSA